MMYYRMIPYLRKYFRLTTIDMLGQGASGSPEFLPKTAQECIDFMALAFEAWLRASKYKEKENYYFMGHSLGGYLGAHFALKFPDKITRVILMSPVGVPDRPENRSNPTTCRGKLVRALWNNNWSPSDVLRKVGYYPGRRFCRRWVKRRFSLPVSEEEEHALAEVIV